MAEISAFVGALRYYNFGETYIRWIVLFYTDFQACVCNFGFSSNWFNITQGLYQGAPETPTVFILLVKILGEQIRNNENIKGIKVNDTELKSGQFTDDMVLFSEFDETSLQSAIDTLPKFEKNTGLKLNYEKSNVHHIGALKNTDVKIITSKELNWTNEILSFLGIDIVNKDDIIEINYKEILSKSKDIMMAWEHRGLSLMGKVVMLNAFVGPLYVYKMNVLPLIPETILTSMEDEINKFLWKGSKPKVSLSLIMLCCSNVV